MIHETESTFFVVYKNRVKIYSFKATLHYRISVMVPL